MFVDSFIPRKKDERGILLNKGQGAADLKEVANSPRPNCGDSGSSTFICYAVKKFISSRLIMTHPATVVLDEDLSAALQRLIFHPLWVGLKILSFPYQSQGNAIMNEEVSASKCGDVLAHWFSGKFAKRLSFSNPDGRIVWVEIEGFYIDI
ncbi:hypothetical protein Tco_0953831 [Tanacetum coccineum]|uniref:Uncharacterized protein n=1 Tax=Tanacetum coccineum TaxID=301880 RepID=A0ABQ5E131_9ASTR